MRVLFIAVALVALAAGPVLAGQCPALQAQIDKAVGNRADATAANTKVLAAQAWSLHQGGKHAESEAKYEEAAKAAGVKLEMKAK